jgi:hypothetical protein
MSAAKAPALKTLLSPGSASFPETAATLANAMATSATRLEIRSNRAANEKRSACIDRFLKGAWRAGWTCRRDARRGRNPMLARRRFEPLASIDPAPPGFMLGTGSDIVVNK